MERKTAVALRGGLPGGLGSGADDRDGPADSPLDVPVVIASGYGAIAREIIARAEASGVPVERDPVLAATLARLRLGQAIPPALYQAVAELLVFLYDLDARQVENQRAVS